MDHYTLWNQYREGRTDFRGVYLSGQSEIPSMKEVDLSEANFSGSNLYLTELEKVNLSHANFENAQIQKCMFSGCNLENTNFQCAELREMGFCETNLKSANFRKSYAVTTSYFKCNLEYADFSKSIICDSEFCETNLSTSSFAYSYLSNTYFAQSKLAEGNLDRARLEKIELIDVILPTGEISDQSIKSLEIASGVVLKPNEGRSTKKIFITTGESLEHKLNYDCIKLKNFLIDQRWKAGDYQTSKIMLQTNRQTSGMLTYKEIRTFPCKDLEILDELWYKYSNGNFGFTVQNDLWKKAARECTSQEETRQTFGNYVGWRKNGSWLPYSELIFDLSAPLGHLPLANLTFTVAAGLHMDREDLMSRVETCQF